MILNVDDFWPKLIAMMKTSILKVSPDDDGPEPGDTELPMFGWVTYNLQPWSIQDVLYCITSISLNYMVETSETKWNGFMNMRVIISLWYIML